MKSIIFTALFIGLLYTPLIIHSIRKWREDI